MAGVFDAWGAFQGQSPKYPSGTIGEVSSYGPELSFLRKWQDAHPGEQLAYVKCVLGGSSITEWLPGTNMWNILKATLDQAKGRLAGAGLTPEWSGLCWMQGENGATGVWTYLNPPPGNEYKDQLRAFLAAVRAETSPQMIAVIGRIGNHMLADNIIDPLVGSGINTKENILGAANNRRAQQVLVGGDSGNCWADTDNLPVLQSGSPAFWYHHTGPGYLAMGERFYAAFAGASPPPPPPSPLAVQFNGTVKPDWIVKLNGVPIGAAGDIIEITGTP
jgi:hypothetical protein